MSLIQCIKDRNFILESKSWGIILLPFILLLLIVLLPFLMLWFIFDIFMSFFAPSKKDKVEIYKNIKNNIDLGFRKMKFGKAVYDADMGEWKWERKLKWKTDRIVVFRTKRADEEFNVQYIVFLNTSKSFFEFVNMPMLVEPNIQVVKFPKYASEKMPFIEKWSKLIVEKTNWFDEYSSPQKCLAILERKKKAEILDWYKEKSDFVFKRKNYYREKEAEIKRLIKKY